MFPEGFLTLDRIRLDCDSHSKKKVLQRIGQLLSTAIGNLDGDDIFDRLFARERLGSTGLGHGVGLPHTRIEDIDEAKAVLFVLPEALEYDAPDQQAVDLIFGLIVPEGTSSATNHLEILAALAALFSDKTMCNKFRSSKDPQQVLDDFNAWCDHYAAKERA